MAEDKSKKRNNHRSNNKHENGNKNESQKHNNDDKGKGNHAKKNQIEVISYVPQKRKTQGHKKQ